MNNGGTEMYCRNCETTQFCKKINLSEFGDESYLGDCSNEQRRWSSKYPDLQFFMRGRKCLVCKSEFITVEIHESALQELVRLREIWDDITIRLGDFDKDAFEDLPRLLSLFQYMQKAPQSYDLR